MKFSDSKVLIFIIKLVLLGLIASWFTRITSIPVYWPGILLLILYTILKNPNVFRHALFLVPFSVGFILIGYYAIGHYNNVPDAYLYPFGPLTDVYPFIISALMLLNIQYSENRKLVIRKVSRFVFYCFLIAIFLSFTTELIFPGISRVRDLSSLPKLFWTMGFGMIYALPFVAATILTALSGFYKHIIAIGLLIFCAYSGFLTLTLFMFIGISIAYYEALGKLARVIFLYSVVVVGIGIYIVGIGGIGVSLLNVLPNEAYLQKAEQLGKVNNSANGGLEDLRGGVYSISLNSFNQFPFFGVGDYSESKIGYHSFWLDKLGFIGLFGTIPYLIILITFYRYLKKRYFLNDKVWVRLNILLFCLLFTNPFQFWDFWIIIYVVLPIIRFGIPKKLLPNNSNKFS